jgi:hypothetical protein
MYFRRKTSAGRTYLQIVESRRDGDQVRQQVIATLGRYEDLQASGQLERLLRSGARFVKRRWCSGQLPMIARSRSPPDESVPRRSLRSLTCAPYPAGR